ncbi:DUF2972 domain-containing protein, partial [Campylobacter troglodytis]|uniref:DUF2972 domain-containing protein n=1 Tax=Campylobacter troglodytis TaxID=654363 RepID=UPI00115BCD04
YLDTNHPYPPLLNPALLNGEDFFENDGLANSKGKGDTGRADGLANSKGEGKSLANLGNKNETLSGGKAEALENSSKQGEACFEGEVSKDEALSGGKAEAVVNSKGEGEGFAKAETQPSKENGALATNTTQSNKEVSNLAHKQNEALSNSSKQDEAVGDNKAEALTNSNSKNEQALTKNSSTNSLKTQASSKDEIQAALKTQALSKSEPQILSNDKSKYKNPDLSYEKIPASLAWQLNLPLPPYYHINFFNNGATASMSILNFFKLCGLRICGYWHYEDAKYKQDYEILIKNKKSFNVIATYINSGTKYFHLLTKKVPLLFVTRDPISKIKSACNHFSSAKISPLMKKFTLANKDFKALFPENIYWGNAAPNINVGFGSHTLQAKLYFDSFLKRVPRFDRFYIFSFDDFSVNKAYETFKKMAKLFKLNMPYDERLYNRRVETKRFGMAVLPTCLYAHKKDLGKDDNALIEGINIHINCDPSLRMKADFFELTEQLLGSKCYINDSEIIIYASKDEARLLLQDKELLEAVKKHLQGYIEALRSNVNETLKSLITEEQVLNFLRKNKEKRKMLKTMCEQELQWFKQNRPEIIASWTYYLEFEKMYKELDEGH